MASKTVDLPLPFTPVNNVEPSNAMDTLENLDQFTSKSFVALFLLFSFSIITLLIRNLLYIVLSRQHDFDNFL